jgi:Ser/Thr protein kinase RdoA (MazF antagonist)
VDGAQPPEALLRDGGLVVLPGQIRPREGRAWLVGWQGMRAVLRQVPVPASGADADAAWLHAFLIRLADLGFCSPRPLPCLSGRSWTMTGGALWQVVSFRPGWAVGWAVRPAMEEIGALLGRYHATVRRMATVEQRPGALPLADVPSILLSGQLDAVHLGADRAAAIRREAERLERALDEAGRLTGERVVIHGDFTNDNVIADGTPPRVAGVIDFALAHAETPLADIGYGLWRSGRPHEYADHLDLGRIARFLRGYAATVPVSADEAHVIPVYIHGRGLQMIAKRIRAGRAETGMLAQVEWLGANTAAVGDALAAAVLSGLQVTHPEVGLGVRAEIALPVDLHQIQRPGHDVPARLREGHARPLFPFGDGAGDGH